MSPRSVWRAMSSGLGWTACSPGHEDYGSSVLATTGSVVGVHDLVSTSEVRLSLEGIEILKHSHFHRVVDRALRVVPSTHMCSTVG